MLTEVSRREKEANITPDHDIDVYMKVTLTEIIFYQRYVLKF